MAQRSLASAALFGALLFTQCRSPQQVAREGTSPETLPMVVHTPAPATRQAYEARALALTNTARQKQGRPPLQLNAQLAEAARRQSAWMARERVVRHHPTSLMTRVRRSGYPAQRVAENVMGPDARYQVISLALCTPEGAVAAWLRSPGHRKNLLNGRLTEVGFAYHEGYWTQILGTPAVE